MRRKHGGIAQLARAIGSYPIGRGFKSNFRYHQWPVGQAVKTPPFHGGNRSSILLRVTKKNIRTVFGCFLFIQAEGLAWNHALACMELPKAYGITKGVFLRLDAIQCSALIPYRLRRIPCDTSCRFHPRLRRDDIQCCALMICNSCGIDDMQCCALIPYTASP